MIVLVCGGRDFYDYRYLSEVLYEIHDNEHITAIVHGDAKGADSHAGSWARAAGVCEIKVPAQWGMGRGAGPIRNGWMVNILPIDLVVAFPGGTGTADMVRQAKAKGKEVREFGYGNDR